MKSREEEEVGKRKKSGSRKVRGPESEVERIQLCEASSLRSIILSPVATFFERKSFIRSILRFEDGGQKQQPESLVNTYTIVYRR